MLFMGVVNNQVQADTPVHCSNRNLLYRWDMIRSTIKQGINQAKISLLFKNIQTYTQFPNLW